MNYKNICVIGAGQMGRQIALNAAIHGFNVSLTDSSKEAVGMAKEWAEEYLEGRIAKGRMEKEFVSTVKQNIVFEENSIKAYGEADIVIEAIIEDIDIKKKVFAELDKYCQEHTILTSNSSSFSPSKYAIATNRQDKVIGLHFFNPALVMELVEVIKGPETSDETTEIIMEVAKQFGKLPILLTKEINGFVVNRILGRIFEEACRLIEAGIATPEEIDLAVEKGLKHPLGPCKLMDMSGLDTCYLIRVQRYAESQESIDKPPRIMKEMYEKGELGKKVGKGFYDY